MEQLPARPSEPNNHQLIKRTRFAHDTLKLALLLILFWAWCSPKQFAFHIMSDKRHSHARLVCDLTEDTSLAEPVTNKALALTTSCCQ